MIEWRFTRFLVELLLIAWLIYLMSYITEYSGTYWEEGTVKTGLILYYLNDWLTPAQMSVHPQNPPPSIISPLQLSTGLVMPAQTSDVQTIASPAAIRARTNVSTSIMMSGKQQMVLMVNAMVTRPIRYLGNQTCPLSWYHTTRYPSDVWRKFSS